MDSSGGKMKHIIIIVSVLILLIHSCSGPVKTEKGKSDSSKLNEANHFSAVTQQLDPGGDLFLYLNTEKINRTIGSMFKSIREFAEANMPKDLKTRFSDVMRFISDIFLKIGFSEISAVGISSKSIDPDLNRSRVIVYRPHARGTGLIWRLLGKSTPLAELDFLPTQTVYADFGHFDPGFLWDWIKKRALESKIKPIQKGVASVEPFLQKADIKLPELLASINGRAGIIFTMDPAQVNHIPLGNTDKFAMPSPALAFIITVQNHYIFELLKHKMTFAKYHKLDQLEQISIPVPPMPIPIAPRIIKSDNLLIIASNEKIVQQILAAKKNRDGLIRSREFKHLSQGLPKKGVGFTFVSKRLVNFIYKIQAQGFFSADPSAQLIKNRQKLLSAFQTDFTFLGILENEKNGLIFTANHPFGLEKIAVMPVVFAAGVVSAIAIPNFIRALQNSKQMRSLGDLKQLGAAIEMYRTEKGYYPKYKTFQSLLTDREFQGYFNSRIPQKDGWGNLFLYTISESGDHYYLASAGKDGKYEGNDQRGSYFLTSMNAFNRDVIYSNGEFVYGPRSR